MRRPNRALCGIVLGLAVLIGCSKKPKTDSGATGSSDPAPVPAQSSKNGPPGGPVKVQPAGGTVAGATQPAPVPVPDGTNLGVATVPSVPSVPGAVELAQVRFDKVEAALTAARGKVVLVDCWARWCPPCLTSFPKLVEKHEKYKDKGLVCVSVSLDAGQNRFTTDQVHAFLKEKKATFQNFYLTDLRSDNATMEGRFGKISGIPHAVLINKLGVKIWEGHPMDNGLVARIETELAK